jgi:hypothetical protein
MDTALPGISLVTNQQPTGRNQPKKESASSWLAAPPHYEETGVFMTTPSEVWKAICPPPKCESITVYVRTSRNRGDPVYYPKPEILIADG